jgi:hypothetical protein
MSFPVGGKVHLYQALEESGAPQVGVGASHKVDYLLLRSVSHGPHAWSFRLIM